MKIPRLQKQRGNVALIVTVVVAVIIAAILIIHFMSRRKPPEVKTFQELVSRVETLNRQISLREEEISGMVSKYNEGHPGGEIDTAGMSTMGMTPEQAELLAQRVAQEKDLSYRGLLQDIIDLNGEISRLNNEVEEVRARLRPPHPVAEGETHFRVCMNFLTQDVGLTEEAAMELVEREAMTSELLPGYEVWNYYGDGVFGTFVTQGQARISPNELQRASKRKIDTERQTLIQARNQKEQEVQDLEARKNELLSQIQGLEAEREAMMAQMTTMGETNDSLAAELNSVRYYSDTFKDLEKEGILRKPALGKWQTGTLPPLASFKSVDLRAADHVVVNASNVGVEKISKVLLFPRYFEEGKDYRIEVSSDKQMATVVFLHPKKFHLGQLVLAVD
jgi:hypothetical protein